MSDSHASARVPARPPWRDFFLVQRMFNQNRPNGLRYLAEHYGSFVRTRLPLHIYFVFDPICIEEVLVKQAAKFRKDVFVDDVVLRDRRVIRQRTILHDQHRNRRGLTHRSGG